jgi:TatD DNase family protein
MNSVRYCDSHAHLTCDKLFGDCPEILARAQTAGIAAIINICTDIVTLQRGIDLHKSYPWMYNAAATTPHDVEKEGELHFGTIEAAAHGGQLVAIGETGLDYYYRHAAPELQQHFLRRYLQLAVECNLPLIIHCREAFSDFFKILDSIQQSGGKLPSGVLHCFTGSATEARELLARGWTLSFSGIVTFKKSQELLAIAAETPLDRMLIETDSPYLAPQNHRGHTNEPSFVPEVAAAIGAAKGLSSSEVAAATFRNTINIFNLDIQ